jgi:hypothetical protein
MQFKTVYPKCVSCGKFIGNGKCIVEKNLDTFEKEPEFFEELLPYHKEC